MMGKLLECTLWGGPLVFPPLMKNPEQWTVIPARILAFPALQKWILS